MNIENTDAQVKAQIIQRINSIKLEAIDYGFDYPTIPPDENDSLENLLNFLVEISSYIAYNVGYNDSVEDAEEEENSPFPQFFMFH